MSTNHKPQGGAMISRHTSNIAGRRRLNVPTSVLFRAPLVLTWILLGIAPAEAASFDCNKAATPVEKLICADPVLSDLDKKLAEAYQRVLDAATDKNSVRRQQHNWLTEQRDVCEKNFGGDGGVGDGAICVLVAYEKRLTELTGKDPDGKFPYWWMRNGHEDPLCQTLYKELRKHRPQDIGSCTGSVALALPGMKEMDGWKELDPREHKELYKKILQYQALGAATYFGTMPTTTQGYSEYVKQKTISDENLEKRYQSFIAVGGRMRVKTLQLMRHPGLYPTSITYEQPQTLLEFRTKWYRTDCPKSPSLNEAVETFYVTADLSGPDPGILDGERATASRAGLTTYKGVVYMMHAGSRAVTLYRDRGNGVLWPTCKIERR